MRKLVQTISAGIAGACLMGTVASAAAVTCGNISTTGNGSTNTINCVDTNVNTVSCVNNVIVANLNSQTSNSGSANSNGNTVGGSASTGSAGNDNNVVVTVGASCAPKGESAFTTSAVVGGQGGGTTAPAAATPSAAAAPAAAPAATPKKAAALPNTGSDTVLNTAVAAVAGIGSVLAISSVGMSAFRRSALK